MGIACDAVGLEAIEQKTIQLMKENLSLSAYFLYCFYLGYYGYIYFLSTEGSPSTNGPLLLCWPVFFTPNHWMYSSISTSFGLGQRPYFGLPYRPRVWWVIMHGLIHVQSVYWFPVFICLRCFCFFCWVFLARSKIKIK